MEDQRHSRASSGNPKILQNYIMTNQEPDDKLTPEQIVNWRNILVRMIGPYALIMPYEDVQKMRDNMNALFNADEPEANATAEHANNNND